MIKKFQLMLFLVALFPASNAQAQAAARTDAVSYSDLIRLTINADSGFMDIVRQLGSAGLTLSRDRDALMPTFQLGYDHSRTFYLDDTTGRYELSLGASYPLRDGGRRRTQVVYDSGRMESLRLKADLITREKSMAVFAKYIDMLTLSANIDALTNAVDRGDYYYKEAQNHLAAGEGIKLDVIVAEAHLKKVRSDLREAEDQLAIARAQLLAAAGLPADSAINISAPASDAAPEIDIDEAVRRAGGLPELRLLELHKSLAVKQSNITASAEEPQINLLSGYQFSGDDFSLGDEAWRLGFSVTYDLGRNRSLSSSVQQDHSVQDYVFPGGITSNTLTQRKENLKMTFYDGSSRKPEVYDSKAQIRIAENDIAAKKLELENQIRESYLALKRDKTLIDALDSFSAAKAETVKARRAEFDLGITKTDDLLEAENDLIQAKSELNRARYANLLHHRAFLSAIGEDPFPELARRAPLINEPQSLLNKQSIK